MLLSRVMRVARSWSVTRRAVSCRDNRLLFGKARKAPEPPSNYLIQELDHPTIVHCLNTTWFKSIQTLERIATNHSFLFTFQRTCLEPFVLCRPKRKHTHSWHILTAAFLSTQPSFHVRQGTLRWNTIRPQHAPFASRSPFTLICHPESSTCDQIHQRHVALIRNETQQEAQLVLRVGSGRQLCQSQKDHP